MKTTNWYYRPLFFRMQKILSALLFFLLIFTNSIVWGKLPANPGTIPGSFSGLVKGASPSVVNISTVKTIRGPRQVPLPFGQDDPFRDFFERFFGGQTPRDFKQQSLGTGFIINQTGYILTNNHVVEGTDEIRVRLEDQREFIASIVGRDSMTDLALIRIQSDRPLKPLSLGDSDKLEVGDWVVAIGNPFGLGNTVTAGIVSAKYRRIGAGPYDNFIQTDTPINPGNSGGPLLNIAGEVIGINTAIFSESGGSVGIGFAIPINIAKDLLPQLKQGKVVRSWLGVIIQKITPELKAKFGLKSERGALVADVAAGSPAEKAGIKRGDAIVSFDDKEIGEHSDLPYVVASTPVGQTVTVTVIRQGREKNFQVTVEELKDEGESLIMTQNGKSTLGIIVDQLTADLAQKLGLSRTSGIVILQVESGSAAAEAGMAPGDIILEVDQVPLRDLSTFKNKVKGYKKKDTVLFLIDRNGTTVYMTLKMPG